ncbi:MAG TPA: serine/threonine-protein kinase, partial [Planctomycetota bacterium]|nr:serine/threonine-protein kinase [Planctomycetota bacterium]
AEDGGPVLRARREFELQRLLDHPSIARVEALVEARGRLHLVAERLRGKTFKDLLAPGPVTTERATAIGAQVASALAHAHGRGVVHRDVAPANIFIVENEPLVVKLADFGLAVPVDRHTTIVEQHRTETGEGMGTPRYDAPEMLFSAKEAGPPADVYALGAVLYHARAGRTPFGDRSDDEWLAAVRKAKPRSVREAAPGTPAKLATLVMRMLEPRPDRRPTAAEVAAALSRGRP